MLAFRKFDTRRKFGVELEVGHKIKKTAIRRIVSSGTDRSVYSSRYTPSTNNAYWHIKDDATCGPIGRGGPKGIEIASFVASGIYDLSHICEVADLLASKGVEVNDNCGLHIHADASDLSEEQVGRIVASWIKLERFISLALPKRRIGNPYCGYLCYKQVSLRGKNPLDFYNQFKPKDLSYYENLDRRVTLNLVNYCRAIKNGNAVRKTLELRWPEGTLSGEEIKNWVRLFLNFIEHAKDAPVPDIKKIETFQESLNLLGLGHSNKQFHFLSEGLFATKIWFLKRIIDNPDLEYCMMMVGCPVLPTPSRKDVVDYLNFISQPVKIFS